MGTQLFWDDVGTTDWEETVGVADPTPVWPAAYNAVIMTNCPDCHALALSICVSAVTKKPRRAPCIARIAAANGQAKEVSGAA
jgi:hypothetical protein